MAKSRMVTRVGCDVSFCWQLWLIPRKSSHTMSMLYKEIDIILYYITQKIQAIKI